MRVFGVVLLIWVVLVGPGFAQNWAEPARGSQMRRDLMDAIRPHAEWLLGAPVEFVVHDLRQSGDRAFASLNAQRPGGTPIDLDRAPLSVRDGWDTEMMDGASIQVLYRKSGNVWVAVLWELGATDVWYSWRPVCDEFRTVLPDAC